MKALTVVPNPLRLRELLILFIESYLNDSCFTHLYLYLIIDSRP